MIREIEVKQHEDGRFRIHSKQRDQPNPHCNAHVVVQEVEEPDRANRRKRHGEKGCGRNLYDSWNIRNLS